MARPWNGTAKYRRGWTGRDFHVTGGHEAEAMAAQEAEKPSRIGLWILRGLGYRGPDPTPFHQPPHLRTPPRARSHPVD